MLLVLGPDRLLYRGPPVDGAPHRHHALQLALSLGTPLQLEADGQVQQAMGFSIAADTPLQLGGGGPQVALLYLEPESTAARQLSAAMPRPIVAWQPSSSLRAAAAGDANTFAALDALWLAELGLVAASPPRALDARVADTLAYLGGSPGATHSAAALAARVQLSPDRLMHLFAEATGTSLRSYALWLKLKTALGTALAGRSLTEAAHAAGFADSAHLSHSFKAMFGLPPRFLFESRDKLTVRFR